MHISIARKIGAVLVFWLLVIFGGGLVMLWNALSPSFAQYRPGDLGYLLLQTISTALGAGIAVWAIERITYGQCKILCLVNCVIAATVFSTLTFLNILIVGLSVQSVISMGFAIVLLIGFAYGYIKEIYKSMTEVAQIGEKYEDFLSGIELLKEFANQARMPLPEYIRHLRITAKRAEGHDEETAARMVDQEERERLARRNCSNK